MFHNFVSVDDASERREKRGKEPLLRLCGFLEFYIGDVLLFPRQSAELSNFCTENDTLPVCVLEGIKFSKFVENGIKLERHE